MPKRVDFAGAVGMDINCGVRLLRTIGSRQSTSQGSSILGKELALKYPTGIGKVNEHQAVLKHFPKIAKQGLQVYKN